MLNVSAPAADDTRRRLVSARNNFMAINIGYLDMPVDKNYQTNLRHGGIHNFPRNLITQIEPENIQRKIILELKLGKLQIPGRSFDLEQTKTISNQLSKTKPKPHSKTNEKTNKPRCVFKNKRKQEKFKSWQQHVQESC